MKILLQLSTCLLASIFFTANASTLNTVLGFPRIDQVLASPDGKQIAFNVFQVESDSVGKRWVYSLYIKDQSGKINLLNKSSGISSLNWSPDGTSISYLANGNEFQSIWVENIKTHRIRKLMEFQTDILSFKWSPDGKYIAFIAEEKKTASKTLVPIDVSHHYTNVRLYIVPAKANITPKPLTSADYSVSDFDWAPDNQSIVFAFQARPSSAYSNENKIAILNIFSHQIKNIPYTENHTGAQPIYSPNGKWIAFVSNLEPSKFATKLNNNIHLNNRICIVNTSSFESHCLANTFNENPGILGWNTKSDNVFVLDTYKTLGYLIYALNINPSISAKTISNIDGFIEPLTITLNASHTIFGFGYETVSNAPEAFISRTEPFKLEQVSHFQSSIKSTLGKTDVIHWKSSDGMDIEGLLVTPTHYQANKTYPLYVAIHGGPAQTWGKRYLGGCDEYGQKIDPTICFSDLLKLGFVILQPNPRGSTGYGRQFRLANFADFGGGDYRDIMSGVDYLIQKGIADPNHLAVGGWSFGGYMTAWIISQTNRFKAAVEGDGNTDFISFSGTSDIPDYYAEYLGNNFWDDDQLYLQSAPISHVKNITTPLLIIGGENDIRVPTTQGYELYTALERQHKPVKMLVLPKQGHVPTDANIIEETIKEVDTWLIQAIH